MLQTQRESSVPKLTPVSHDNAWNYADYRQVRQAHTPPRTSLGSTPPYRRPKDALGVHFPELDTGVDLPKERSDHSQ